MLFLQGTRDALAASALIRQIAGELGERATLEMFPDADHSFHVPARSGRTDEQVRGNVLDALADWMTRIAGG
jgi:dienelactone hydrolase